MTNPTDLTDAENYYLDVVARRKRLQERLKMSSAQAIENKITASTPVFSDGVQGDRDRSMLFAISSLALVFFLKTPGFKLELVGIEVNAIPAVAGVVTLLAASLYYNMCFLINSRIALIGWNAILWSGMTTVVGVLDEISTENDRLNEEIFEVSLIAYNNEELEREIGTSEDDLRRERRIYWKNKRRLSQGLRHTLASTPLGCNSHVKFRDMDGSAAKLVVEELEKYSRDLLSALEAIQAEGAATIGLKKYQVAAIRYVPLVCSSVFYGLTLWELFKNALVRVLSGI